MRQLYLFLCMALAITTVAQDYTQNAKRFRDKFTFELAPGETVIRTWFHYVVTSTADGRWAVRVFYPETGRLTHLTTYADEACTVRSGLSTYWYDDGTLVHTGNYDRYGRAGVWIEGADSGTYVNNTRQGAWRFGREGKLTTLVTGNYDNGLMEGKWITRDSLDRQILMRTFHKDKLHGEWVSTDPVTGTVKRRVYLADSLIEGIPDTIALEERMSCWKECSTLTDPAERVHCTETRVMQYLSKTMVYPNEARKMYVSGSAQFSFVIDVDGSIVDIKTRTGLCKDIEQVCRDVISKMPAWEPGTQNRKSVRVQYDLPIKFTLR